MNQKDFLRFLIQQKVLTPEQARTCLQKAVQEKKALAQILTQQYLSAEEMSLFIHDFQQLSENQPALTPSVPAPVKPIFLAPVSSSLLEEVEQFSHQKTNLDMPLQNRNLLGSEEMTLPSAVASKGNFSSADILSKMEDIDQRYQVLETLGEGGMGVVQRVLDHLLGREIAMKKIKMGSPKKETLSPVQQMMIWRFSREASITAILEHQNIVPLYEMQQNEGEICFTMRKIDGQNLSVLLHKKRTHPEENDESQILSIFSKICNAVAYAHSRGVIHRDLKPENVMVGQYGEVYVMDWGIAKKLHEDEAVPTESFPQEKRSHEDAYKTIGGVGTPGYMSPEQQENASLVTVQSDIYALGKILRQCFTGLSPMEEIKQEALRTQKKSKVRQPSVKKSTSEDEEIPLDIQAILEKATKSNPEERYPSVNALESDLQNYLKNIRVSVRDYTSLELLKKWLQRNKQKVLIATFILFLWISFPAYFQWKNYQEKQNKFEESFQRALAKFKEADQQEETSGKQEIQQKIELLLEALNHFNTALSYHPEDPKSEEYKYETGKKLLPLCFKTQDYQLARYIAKNMNDLLRISQKDKENLLQEVLTQQNATLLSHKERLHFWVEKIKSGKMLKGDPQEAIFEISKMPEDEILQELIHLTQEGTLYFLKNTQPISAFDEGYCTLAEALGRLENPKVGPLILRSLKQMADTITNRKKFHLAEITYMIQLFRAITLSTPTSDIFYELENIRFQLGTGNLFSYGTETEYLRLLKTIHSKNIQDNSFENYTHTAMLALSNKNFTEAVEYITKALELQPQMSKLYTLRGNAKRELHEYAEAIKDYNQAFLTNPQEPDRVFMNRALLYRLIRKYPESLSDFNEAIRINPEAAQYHLNRGIIYYDLKKYEKAESDCQKAIELDAQYAHAYNLLGLVYEALNQSQKSLPLYDTALQLNPELEDAYENRANLKYAEQDYPGALNDFQTLLRINPQSSNAYHGRANIKTQQDDLSGALRDYDTALSFAPNSSSILIDRGILKREMEDLEGSLQDLNTAQNIDPQYVRIYNHRGFTRYLLKDFSGALEDLNKAIEMDARYTWPYLHRAQVKIDQQDLSGAIEDCLQSLRLNPEFARAYFHLARAQIRQQKLEDAKIGFMKYLKLTQQLTDLETKKSRQEIFEIFPELKTK
ncbi:MAG: tetratricopeptide repeat protein [Planctomycetota bacterium]